MAERRMFAKSIVTSDDFLDMPMSARCLYFTLGMLADDDGFVNSPKSIMRQVGATDDDMKILLAKRYVLAFESGVIVIRHWRIHNYIRGDRYNETVHIEEKSQLTYSNNGKVYEQPLEISTRYTNGTPTVDTGKVSIGKDSIGEISKGEDKKYICPRSSDLKEEFETLWSLYPKKQGKPKALEYYIKARKDGTTYEEVENGINAYVLYIKENEMDMQFVKMGSTFFSQRAWSDDWTVYKRQKKVAGSRRELFANLIKEHEDDI